MNRRHVFIVAFLISMVGLSIFYYKVRGLGFPLMSDAEISAWTIEATVRFDAGRRSIKVDLRIPGQIPGYSILQENFVSRGYGLSTREESGGRVAQWAVRRAKGDQVLYYRAVVYRDRHRIDAPAEPLDPSSMPVLGEPYDTALAALVDDVRAHSADVPSFTAELLRRLNDPTPDPYVDMLLDQADSDSDRAHLITTLLAGAHIPARVVHGVFLQTQSRSTNIVSWLEVYDGHRWQYFNPQNGEWGLPRDFLIWWHGSDPIASLAGGSDLDVRVSVQRNVVDAMAVAERRAEQRESRVVDFSLFDLPIHTQAVYGVLLLIPVGAFIMVILRNIVGIRTFGTFMPILVALAFRETQLVTGLILFTLVVALGLSIRFYLEKLRLLLVPRLTVVLIVVVMLMVGLSILSHRLGLETGLSVALFPMVILTMFIERMSVVWEERGPAEASIEGAGSMVVASVAYLFMSLDTIEYLVFVYPELLLILLALTLLIGRYTGYRLFELVRFREFLERKG